MTDASPEFRLESGPARLVPASEFASALGISPSGLRYLIERGTIDPPIREGQRRGWAPSVVAFHVQQRARRLGRSETETETKTDRPGGTGRSANLGGEFRDDEKSY